MWKYPTLLMLLTSPALAGPSYVGNGDGGADLEGATPLTGGPIADARTHAVELLKKLNVQGVQGLGLLIPEVESTQLYLARGDRAPEGRDDQGAFHADMRGRVFARTFAHPHAATRFFPVALGLSDDQLIALNVHEGLHRSLPPSIAEDEAKVTALTLAITAPNATFDQIAAVAAAELPSRNAVATATDASVAPTLGVTGVSSAQLDTGSHASLHVPIELSYTYQSFQGSNGATYVSAYDGEYVANLSGVSSLQKIETKLLPFADRIPLSINLGLGVLSSDAGSGIGPSQVELTLRLTNAESSGFELTAWGRSSFALFSSSLYQQTGFDRNVSTVGLTARWESDDWTIKDSLALTAGGAAPVSVTPEANLQSASGQLTYASSMHEKISVSRQADHLRLGGFVQASLGGMELDTTDAFGQMVTSSSSVSRSLLIALGPEIAWVEKRYSFSVDGRFVPPVMSATFDAFGDLWNQGTGTSAIDARFSLFF